MSILEIKIGSLKEKLENLAFLVSKGGSEKEAHSEIIKSIMLVSEIENEIKHAALAPSGGEINHEDSDTDEILEIRKVESRLRLWAKRQDQYNAQILNCYLELERDGEKEITEDLLRDKSQIDTFDGNFNGMKTIGPKNHGKVFDVTGDVVKLWPPVVKYIREYERKKELTGVTTMSIREQAKKWLAENHPSEIMSKFRVSKYYSSIDVWFFTFPESYYDNNKVGYLNILLQHENDLDKFHFLKVPYSFFRENKSRLCNRSTGDKFDLHISAKQRNWLICERSQNVSFKEFLQ